MCALYHHPFIRGFTTNPTLMCKAGITDYESFARGVLAAIPDRPISFEVFSEDFAEMEQQALKIASWGRNVYAISPEEFESSSDAALPHSLVACVLFCSLERM